MKGKNKWLACGPAILPLISAFVQAAHGFESQIQNSFLDGLMKRIDESCLSDSELNRLEKYIAEHPKDADAHLVLATSYRKAGLDGLYADELEKAWLLSPDSMIYLITALKIHGGNEDSGRIKVLADEALELYYKDSRRLSTLGTLFRNNNQNDLSEKFLSRAMEIDPENRKLRANFCTTLLVQKKYQKVLTHCDELFSHPETKSFAFLIKGVSLLKLNQSREALALLRTAFSADKQNPEAAEAYFDALCANGLQNKSLLPGLTALACQPAFSPHIEDLKKKLVQVFSKQKQTEIKSAADLVAQTTGAEQALAFYYYALADILDRSEKRRLAVDYYSRGIQIFPYGRAYMRLARDMEITDMVPADTSFDLFSKAMELSPNDDEVKACYLRAKVRLPANNRDLAGKIKASIAGFRY